MQPRQRAAKGTDLPPKPPAAWVKRYTQVATEELLHWGLDNVIPHLSHPSDPQTVARFASKGDAVHTQSSWRRVQGVHNARCHKRDDYLIVPIWGNIVRGGVEPRGKPMPNNYTTLPKPPSTITIVPLPSVATLYWPTWSQIWSKSGHGWSFPHQSWSTWASLG